eukprot:g1799.t1
MLGIQMLNCSKSKASEPKAPPPPIRPCLESIVAAKERDFESTQRKRLVWDESWVSDAHMVHEKKMCEEENEKHNLLKKDLSSPKNRKRLIWNENLAPANGIKSLQKKEFSDEKYILSTKDLNSPILQPKSTSEKKASKSDYLSDFMKKLTTKASNLTSPTHKLSEISASIVYGGSVARHTVCKISEKISSNATVIKSAISKVQSLRSPVNITSEPKKTINCPVISVEEVFLLSDSGLPCATAKRVTEN